MKDSSYGKDWFVRILMLLVGVLGTALYDSRDFATDLVALQSDVKHQRKDIDRHEVWFNGIQAKLDEIHVYVIKAEGRREVEDNQND